ncbi:uncharacterized protein LOC105390907 [Plutella xylostella]|uniref:uncharacterized protein LOC105390907 n=1 Tax=Plutella xylostella TaxID=51655 RepID=UPI002033136B|nr:uncharacterized protein LOC105390907 [Plutella xylostella]
MMSKKQLACMFALHIIYLLLGASIFYHIESPLEMAQRAEEKLERLEIQNLLYENYIPNDPDKQDSILRKLSDYCGKSMFNYTTEDEEPPIKWDFYHSFFFSYTVVSTIGYGNLSPTTHLSRILMIFYGLFGIPINGILLANLGEYFGLQLITVYRRYKRRDEKRADRLDYFFHNLGMLGQIFLYLVPGFLFFIFLPACIFIVFEGWDYVAAIYYAFVTLTTIGFGDLVAGTVNNGFASGYFFIYEIFLIIWITFGLGYIVMLLGFITSGMRSEGVHRMEQKLAYHFKMTQNRILNGFSRDMNVIRKIINEANLIKIKPVYIETAPYLYRSKSCPTLTFDIEPRDPVVKRKRANSENITLSARDMLRIQSDTDLLGIDKEKTFTASAIVKPAELLARVVNVLGGLEPKEDRGVHMFDDDQILATEKPPLWTIGQDTIITNSPQRNRALSVAVPNYRKEPVDPDHAWSNGDPNTKLEAVNVRHGKMSLPTTIPPEIQMKEPQHRSFLSKLFRKQSSEDSNPEEYLKNTMKGRVSGAQEYDKPKRRGSIFPSFNLGNQSDEEENMAKAYREKTKRGRTSIFPTFDFSEDEDAAAARAYREKSKRHSIFPTFDFHEDEDAAAAKAYRDKTKAGRRSIFPTFDFSETEDDMARKYKESTKRGRHSIFPTFDFLDEKSDDEEDDDIDEEELRRYQSRTQKGRLSLFPTFGKSKKSKDEDAMPENSDELQRYQNKTKSGRGSLFPSFGKDRKNSSAEDESPSDLEASIRQYQNKTKSGRGSLFPSFGKDRKNNSAEEDSPNDLAASIKEYQNKTKRGRGSLFPSFGKDRSKSSSTEEEPSDLEASIKQYQKQSSRGRNSLFSGDIENYRNSTQRGRPSLFDPNLNMDNLEEDEKVEVLEQTSVADLLRALTVLEAVAPQQKRGSFDATSFLGLLAGEAASPAPQPTRRRGSIRPDFAMPNLPSRLEPSEEPAGPRRRRVSARAATPQFTPTLATVVAGAELQTTATAARENRMSMINHPPPPPYSEATATGDAETQGPRQRRFSPAPGNVGRANTGPVPRLFSRIRKESVNSIEEEASTSRRGSLTDVVIDNNKDNT